MSVANENVEKTVLPERLRFLRLRNDWSKTDVQRKLGLPTLSTYASYEYGGRAPRTETLLKIAELYDVSVDFLLGKDDEETVKELKFFDSFSNENVRRWLIENLSDANEDDFNKLKSMWELIQK